MKTIEALITGSILAAALALAPNAGALAINDNNYVGRINPGTPADPTDEGAYAQYLIDLFNGDETDATNVAIPGSSQTQNFFLTSGGLAGPLPDFGVSSGHLLNGSGALNVTGTYDITGVTYLYAYYGNGALDPAGPGSGDDGQLWYVGNLTGTVTIPTKGLSHVSFGGGRNVPDAGTTFVLLGAGMIGVDAIRRRLKK